MATVKQIKNSRIMKMLERELCNREIGEVVVLIVGVCCSVAIALTVAIVAIHTH